MKSSCYWQRVSTNVVDKLSQPRVDVLRILLDGFVNACAVEPRLEFDPVQLPRRYDQPDDIEVAALISAVLAYGRASVFKVRIEEMLGSMGPHPASFARAYSQDPRAAVFGNIRYRFNESADFAALVAAIGWMCREHGGLGPRFGNLFRASSLRAALASFAGELRSAPPVQALLRQRGERGLRYLLPDASLPGACKRWHLYLRWMVRGPDAVDFGVWRKFVPKSELIIPLDTHIARVANYIGLTDRTDLSWRTALEITETLRKVDPADPVRFDFALCHHGMSGACPASRVPQKCASCLLYSVCRVRASADPKGC